MSRGDSVSRDKLTTIDDITDMTLNEVMELFDRSREEYTGIVVRIDGDRYILAGQRRVTECRSCLNCVARRTTPELILSGDEWHHEFLCARRGYIIEVMGPCRDYADALSTDPAIVQGGNPIIVSPATAVDALRRGRAVAIDDVWYTMHEGRLCTLSPRGDAPRAARERWTPSTLEGHVCIVIDHEEADDRADRARSAKGIGIYPRNESNSR